ncbi:hypothetical protein [Gimesia sp.]|uniref:hypothetical protein n=1 Tax=Gimesia sp. TaxID=2024833 RepID=UPI003A94B2BC
MAIEIEIIPTVKHYLTWSTLKSRLIDLRPDLFSTISGKSLKLFQIENGIEHEVFGDELICPSKSYRFDINKKYGLFLGVYSNVATYTNEEEYIDDFSCNLNECMQIELAEKWRTAGYSFDVVLRGIQFNPTLDDFIVIAVAAAQLCDGYILLKDKNIFDIPPGAYLPGEFILAKSRFV